MGKLALLLGFLVFLAPGCGSGIDGSAATASGTFFASSAASGDLHACALQTDGTIRCWGDNSSGQLGDDTTATRLAPVTVAGINSAVEVSAGGAHTCALLSDGTVRCWGLNSSGQLGDATTSSAAAPVAVSGIANAAAISAGSSHTCALLGSGAVLCWGRNRSGQLGDGTTSDSSSPVQVSGISTAASITAGGSHTCARLVDGTVRCWGSSSFDQLGNTGISTGQRSATPVEVTNLSSVASLEAGTNHTCATLASGEARCWGDNSRGQLGAAWTLISVFPVVAFTTSRVPVAVTNVTSATSITAGGSHSCALLSDNTLRCWGENESGQLGNGSFVGLTPPGPGTAGTATVVPVSPLGLSAVTGVSAGLFHTCARLSGGVVSCWGANTSGQLGDSTGLSSAIPVNVSG